MYFHSQFVNVTFPQPIRVTNEVWVTVRVHSLTKFLLAYFNGKVTSPFCPPPKSRGRGTPLQSGEKQETRQLGLEKRPNFSHLLLKPGGGFFKKQVVIHFVCFSTLFLLFVFSKDHYDILLLVLMSIFIEQVVKRGHFLSLVLSGC